MTDPAEAPRGRVRINNPPDEYGAGSEFHGLTGTLGEPGKRTDTHLVLLDAHPDFGWMPFREEELVWLKEPALERRSFRRRGGRSE